MRRRLEREIRLLPQVLACSVTADDQVVVLVERGADPTAVHAAVLHHASALGLNVTARLIGLDPSVAEQATGRRGLRPGVLVSALAGLSLLGAGALIAGTSLGPADRSPPNAHAQVAALGAPTIHQRIPVVLVRRDGPEAIASPIAGLTSGIGGGVLGLRLQDPIGPLGSGGTSSQEGKHLSEPATGERSGSLQIAREGGASSASEVHLGWTIGNHYGWSRGRHRGHPPAWSHAAFLARLHESPDR